MVTRVGLVEVMVRVELGLGLGLELELELRFGLWLDFSSEEVFRKFKMPRNFSCK